MKVGIRLFVLSAVALLPAAPLRAAPDQSVLHRVVARHATRPVPRRRAGAGHAFDGFWSVLVVTQKGNCDRAYRWGVGIVNGRFANVGDVVAQVSGSISAAGRVAARFSRGSDVLIANGALSGKWGSGAWTSPTQACSGYWRAEKRPRPGAQASAS